MRTDAILEVILVDFVVLVVCYVLLAIFVAVVAFC